MKKKNQKQLNKEALREKAETKLKESEQVALMPEDYGDMQKLIHELQVHRIELEMQNEELRRAQEELQESRDNYFDFYDFSPVGYFTFNTEGLILDTNLTSSAVLNNDRKTLMNKPFAQYLASECIPAFINFCKIISTSKGRQTCELKLSSPPSGLLWPGLPGSVRQSEEQRRETHIILEGKSAPDNTGQGNKIRVVMVDITERKEMEAELVRSKEMYKKALKATIKLLVSTLEAKVPTMAEHRRRVTKLACAIAQELGFPETCIEGIKMAGTILDLGYISVPCELLSKPFRLNEIESTIIKTHVQTGYDLLQDIEFPWPVAQMVLQHHEKINGSGFPNGIKGDDMLPEAKVLSIANVVEEICCAQAYRSGLGIEKALEEIEKNRGVLYDEQAAEVCLKLFREKGSSFE